GRPEAVETYPPYRPPRVPTEALAAQSTSCRRLAPWARWSQAGAYSVGRSVSVLPVGPECVRFLRSAGHGRASGDPFLLGLASLLRNGRDGLLEVGQSSAPFGKGARTFGHVEKVVLALRVGPHQLAQHAPHPAAEFGALADPLEALVGHHRRREPRRRQAPARDLRKGQLEDLGAQVVEGVPACAGPLDLGVEDQPAGVFLVREVEAPQRPHGLRESMPGRVLEEAGGVIGGGEPARKHDEAGIDPIDRLQKGAFVRWRKEAEKLAFQGFPQRVAERKWTRAPLRVGIGPWSRRRS